MVRALADLNSRPPWGLFKKGRKGWRKIGPIVMEKPTWPSRDREFPELNPKWYGTNPKQLHSRFFFVFTLLFCSLRLYARQSSWLQRSRNGKIHFDKRNGAGNDSARSQ